MVWVIVQFSDLSVACVPKKWLKNGKFCYYPKTGAAKKIKAAVDVDVKSKEWKIYSYRMLMNGDEFETYLLARKAEIIAQNHSTMKSFEESYALKQKTRKRPVVHFGSLSPASTTGSEHQDFKNIRTLSNRDAGLDVDMDKNYNYIEHSGKINNGSPSDEQLSDSDDELQSLKNDGSIETDQTDNDSNCSSASGKNNKDKNGFFIEDQDDNPSIESGDDSSINDNSSSEEEENNHANRSNENNTNLLSPIGNDFPLESTNKDLRDLNISSINSGYHHFSDARRIPHIERAVMSACQLLEENAKMVKEIRQNSRETKLLVESLIPIVKDLTVEVFDSKEEIKKRNGLFTDVLEPKIQLSIKKVKQFENVELALKKHMMVDNMIKYLGSTINESNEKNFIKRCLDFVFEEKFFMNKVWWKKKPGKVLMKHSMILHCIRECFKAKFGCVEPPRSDKTVNDLIHKIGRNVKDNIRKSIKAKEKEMAAQKSKLNQGSNEKDENNKMLQEGEVAKIKKTAKEAAKRAVEENEKFDDEINLNAKGKKFKENSEARKSDKKSSKLAKKTTKEVELSGTDQKGAKQTEHSVVDMMNGNVEEKLQNKEHEKKKAKKLAKLEKTKQDAEQTKSFAGEVMSENDEEKLQREEHEKKKAKKQAKKLAKLEQAKQDAEQAVLNRRGEKGATQDEEDAQVNLYVKLSKKLRMEKKIKRATKG